MKVIHYIKYTSSCFALTLLLSISRFALAADLQQVAIQQDPKQLIAAGNVDGLREVIQGLSEADRQTRCQEWLSDAVRSGNRAILTLLLEEETSLNEPGAEGGEAPMHVAACEGDVGIMDFLLSRGGCIDVKMGAAPLIPVRGTPLYSAVFKGQQDMVRFLLSKGADLQKSATMGGSYLVPLSAFRDQENILVMLLDAGAGIDAVTYSFVLGLYGSPYCGTALCYAVLNGNSSMIRLLRSRGASTGLVSGANVTPLHCAAMQEVCDILELLIGEQFEGEIDVQDLHGKAPLHWASQYGQVDAIKFLLGKNAKVDAEDRKKRTPLYLAAQSGHVNAVKILLQEGASVNGFPKGKVPLHGAAKRGKKTVFEVLLEHDAHIQLQDHAGYSALQRAMTKLHMVTSDGQHWEYANFKSSTNIRTFEGDVDTDYGKAIEGQLAITKQLLDKGVPLDMQNDHGDTALHRAVLSQQPRLVECLIRAQAQVNIRNALQRTPLCLAIEGRPTKSQLSIGHTLLNHGAFVCANDLLLRQLKRLDGALLASTLELINHIIAHLVCHGRYDYTGSPALAILFRAGELRKDGSYSTEKIASCVKNNGNQIFYGLPLPLFARVLRFQKKFVTSAIALLAYALDHPQFLMEMPLFIDSPQRKRQFIGYCRQILQTPSIKKQIKKYFELEQDDRSGTIKKLVPASIAGVCSHDELSPTSLAKSLLGQAVALELA